MWGQAFPDCLQHRAFSLAPSSRPTDTGYPRRDDEGDGPQQGPTAWGHAGQSCVQSLHSGKRMCAFGDSEARKGGWAGSRQASALGAHLISHIQVNTLAVVRHHAGGRCGCCHTFQHWCGLKEESSLRTPEVLASLPGCYLPCGPGFLRLPLQEWGATG